MATSAIVKDGQIQGTQNSVDAEKKKVRESNSSLDKDAFLQLLVAQMKYQDPLEPTSNTEYVAQLATFSQLEETQNVRQSTDLQRASSLVGKQVIMNVDGQYYSGKVDYVVFEAGKAYLSIEEELYNLEDLDTVADGEYLDAYNKAKEFVGTLMGLPTTPSLTLSNKDTVTKLRENYDKMSDYEKSFIASDVLKILESAEARIKELEAIEGGGEEEKPPEGDKEEDKGDSGSGGGST